MKNKKINRAERLIRPYLTSLLILVIVVNLYVAINTLEKNRHVRQVNAKLEKQIEQAEELQLKSEEVYLQNVEDIKRLDDLINRFRLHLDQLDSQ